MNSAAAIAPPADFVYESSLRASFGVQTPCASRVPGLVAKELNVAAFFMLAVLSSEVFGVVLAGYASASKWSLFGGVREAAQVVSYEVPRALCVVVPVCVTGTLNLNLIGTQQVGWFWAWNIFHDPFTFVAFFIFFITGTASCKRAFAGASLAHRGESARWRRASTA